MKPISIVLLVLLSRLSLACSCDMDFMFGTLAQKFDDHEIVVVGKVKTKEAINDSTTAYIFEVKKSFKGVKSNQFLMRVDWCPYKNFEVGESHFLYTRRKADGTISAPHICMETDLSTSEVINEIKQLEHLLNDRN